MIIVTDRSGVLGGQLWGRWDEPGKQQPYEEMKIDAIFLIDAGLGMGWRILIRSVFGAEIALLCIGDSNGKFGTGSIGKVSQMNGLIVGHLVGDDALFMSGTFGIFGLGPALLSGGAVVKM